MRDDTGRLVADAENAALALGHDLELHRRLVEPGMPPLELTQRCPLRLADRLAGRLGRQIPRSGVGKADTFAHCEPPSSLRLLTSFISGLCASSCDAPGGAAASRTEPVSAAGVLVWPRCRSSRRPSAVFASCVSRSQAPASSRPGVA